MARLTEGNLPTSTCRFCSRTFVNFLTFKRHLQSKHKGDLADEERRRKLDQKLKEIEQKRLRAVELRSKVALGIQTYSGAVAEACMLDRDIEDVVEELQIIAQAKMLPVRPSTPERWDTTRAVQQDDYDESESDLNTPGASGGAPTPHSKAASRPGSPESMDLDSSRKVPLPPHISQALNKEQEYKVVEKTRNLNSGHVFGTVPREQLLFDVTDGDVTRGPWYPFADAFSFNMARWLSKYRASSAMIREGYNLGLLSRVSTLHNE